MPVVDAGSIVAIDSCREETFDRDNLARLTSVLVHHHDSNYRRRHHHRHGHDSAHYP